MTTTTAYDAAGNATLATDPAGNQTLTTFDALNRPVDVKQQSSGATPTVVSDKQTNYDGAGNVVSTVVDPGDPNGTPAHKNLVTSYTFDAANRTKTKTEPPASPGATDQSGYPNTTTSTYDAAGNVTDTVVTNDAVTTGPVSATHAVYDAVGMQTSKTEESGTDDAQTTTYAHDAAGRQTSMTTSAGTASAQTTTTAYDADGRQASQTNSAGTTTDTYDPLGRVASETRTVGGATQTTVSYQYDANGNQTQKSTSYLSGTLSIVQSQYDALDRLSWMNDGTRSNTYDANGNVTHMSVAASEQSGTALAVAYGYDGGNRLTAITDTVGPSGTQLHRDDYTYDGSGNRSSIAADGTTTRYHYDGENQLTEVRAADDVTELATYSYDAHHNRAVMWSSAGGTTSYSYDTAGVELTQLSDPAGIVTTYAYDPDTGDLTSSTRDPSGAHAVTSYTYGSNGAQPNVLSGVSKPDGTTVSYSYDADGNRIQKTVASGTTTTTVKGVYQLGLVAYETDGAGTLPATFTYDSEGVPVSVQVGSDPASAPRYYYIYNGHGDVMALVDGSGAARSFEMGC